jgi:hypothetical protein
MDRLYLLPRPSNVLVTRALPYNPAEKKVLTGRTPLTSYYKRISQKATLRDQHAQLNYLIGRKKPDQNRAIQEPPGNR